MAQAFTAHDTRRHEPSSLLNSHTDTSHDAHGDHFESSNLNITHHHADDHKYEHGHGHDSIVVWRGVVVLVVLVVFFIVERLLNIFGEWRQRLQSSKQVCR